MFVKEFSFTKDKGLILKNETDLKSFLVEKINDFSNHNFYIESENWENFFKEIIAMINHDITSAVFDFSEIMDVEGYNPIDYKDKMIKFYNLTYVFGALVFEVFDRPGNRIVRIEEGSILPVSTTGMFAEAYSNLVKVKNNIVDINYGMTLILMTLIEHDLKLSIKQRVIRNSLISIQNKVESSEIKLTVEEMDLVNYLRKQVDLPSLVENTVNYNSVEATRKMAFDLFVTKGVIIDNKYNQRLFEVIESFTLNQIIQETEFKLMVKDSFYEILNLVFSNSNIGLRNKLAHCDFKYENYYHPYITSSLLGIFLYLLRQDFYK